MVWSSAFHRVLAKPQPRVMRAASSAVVLLESLNLNALSNLIRRVLRLILSWLIAHHSSVGIKRQTMIASQVQTSALYVHGVLLAIALALASIYLLQDFPYKT
jgi:hypothetical protein